MAKDKCPECPKCLPGWLVQFGDLMSLLLVFFILLLSMAVMDKKKVEEYFTIMKKAMGFLDKTSSVDEQTDALSEEKQSEQAPQDSEGSEMDEAAQQMQEVVEEMNQAAQQSQTQTESQQIEVIKSQNEFILDIPTTLLFKDDEYELTNTESRAFIAKVARIVRTMPNTFQIEIIGHTDRSKYKSEQLPRDNWDISALRSISVVKELIKNKIDPAQLKVSAHASYKPKSDVASENRRVEMRFYSDKEQNDVFAQENFFDRLE
ncbi:MAG: OmpA family protein [Arcobacteraceae bacterium]